VIGASKRIISPACRVFVRGFTLMEVAVALLILSLVLASSLQVVGQYADERVLMRERFFANRVAWNRLLEKYEELEGWHSSGNGNLELRRRWDNSYIGLRQLLLRSLKSDLVPC
jgi:type II secretion system protein I